MQIGLFTPIFSSLTLDQLFLELKKYPEVTAIEIGCGGWPGDSHINVKKFLADKVAAKDYRQRFVDANLTISALSCHNNPVHPDPQIAARDRATIEDTIRLAERLEVPVVITFSGCPGGALGDSTPNWITAAWPPEYQQMLDWQWEHQLIPYWQTTELTASNAGVKIALEAHPGFCVYNPETLLRLRDATGKSLGINLDPSHMWWQGIDIPTAIADLGDAIFHFHAKDVFLNVNQTRRNGVVDTKNYSRMNERSWLFRSVGWGHAELEWKAIASALRLANYDYVMSIEHEDALASTSEGLHSAVSMLSRVLLREPPVDAFWT
jgi:sugar phosphate isomerase/epimerase